MSGPKLNLILLLVFIVLGGAALLVENPFAEKSEKYVEYGLLFPEFNPENVWELVIRREENEVQVKRTETGWVVPTRYDHPADMRKVQQVFYHVTQWKNQVQVGQTTAKHDKMAVSEETGTFVSLSDLHGEPLAQFFVGRIGGFDAKRLGPGGKLEPDEITFYLRPYPGEAVYLIREFLIGAFTFQPEHWVDKQIFRYPKDTEVKVTARGEAETVNLEKSGEDWTVQGFEHPVDPNQIQQTLNNLRALQGADIADPAVPLEEYGLDAPRMHATVTLENGTEYNLLIGKEKDDKRVYGKSARSRFPMEITANLLDKIFRKKEDFEQKSLFTFRVWDSKRITLEHPDETVVLEKAPDSNQWQITTPEGMTADRAAISSVVSGFGRMKLESYVEKGGDLAKYGLAEPAFKATAEMEEETHVLLIGSQDEQGRYYAKKEADAWIVLLGAKATEKVMRTAKSLREKTADQGSGG